MAASASLMTYLHGLGLTDAQIQSLISSAGGSDGTLNENDVAAAAARYASALASGALNGNTGTGSGTGSGPGSGTGDGTGDGTTTPPAPNAPNGQFPGAGTGGGNNFAPGDPQYAALQNPTTPYLDTSTSGGIAFTPEQSSAWWAQWMANPVNLLTVPPVLLPGSLTNDPATIAKIQAMSDAAPAAPHNYDPLSLPIDPGQGSAGYGDGSTWDAAKNLQALPALGLMGNGTPAQAADLAALKSLGITNPQYTGPGESSVAANPAAVAYNAGVPTYVTDPKTGQQTLQYQTPSGQAYNGVVPGSADEYAARAASSAQANPPANPSAPPLPTPDYAALAAQDDKYAANLAKSNPSQAAVYAARAADYRSRATTAPVAPAAQPAAAAPNPAVPPAPPTSMSATLGFNPAPASSAAPQNVVPPALTTTPAPKVATAAQTAAGIYVGADGAFHSKAAGTY